MECVFRLITIRVLQNAPNQQSNCVNNSFFQIFISHLRSRVSHVWHVRFVCVTRICVLQNARISEANLFPPKRRRYRSRSVWLLACPQVFFLNTLVLFYLIACLSLDVWVWGVGVGMGVGHSYVCHHAFICVPWLVHMCVMAQSYACYDSFICLPWLIRMCAMTHSHMCHSLFISVSWRVHMFPRTPSYVCHDSFIYVPSHIQICAMTYSYVRYDAFICVPWLIHMFAMTHSYVHRDEFIWVPWLIHMCTATNSNVYRDSFISVPWIVHMSIHRLPLIRTELVEIRSESRYSFICAPWLIHMCATTHIYVHPPFATDEVESIEIGNEFVDTVSIKQMSSWTLCPRSEGVMAYTGLD